MSVKKCTLWCIPTFTSVHVDCCAGVIQGRCWMVSCFGSNVAQRWKTLGSHCWEKGDRLAWLFAHARSWRVADERMGLRGVVTVCVECQSSLNPPLAVQRCKGGRYDYTSIRNGYTGSRWHDGPVLRALWTPQKETHTAVLRGGFLTTITNRLARRVLARLHNCNSR
jgi:hypothetical protein